MVIAAALSIQDPRERPMDTSRPRPTSRTPGSRDPTSDFLGCLNLWTLPAATSRRSCRRPPFRRMCKREFLNYLRIREWQDLYAQLRQLAKQLGITAQREPARATRPGSTPRCSPACCRTSA